MSIYNYTTPSGATYQVNVPAGTTQAQADYIFYSQMAAGTFVGYKPGDTLTHPVEALTNFGLTRLERGTAGVNDQTLLAITAGLPLVATIPTLTNIPIQNAITQADYIQVNSNPTQGLISQGTTSVGDLTNTQTQAVMAQLAAITNQPADQVSQQSGIGKYGFNAQQLERAGIIKPGYAQKYCPLNPSTQENPDNFLSFLESPSPWTGLYGITSLADILSSEALQNTIQQNLMQQSYEVLVGEGIIKPSTPSVTTPSASTGYVYRDTGVLASASTESLLAINANNLITSNTISTGNVVGTIPTGIANLGANASTEYTSGLSSLSTGAVGFNTNTLANISTTTGNSVSQLPGLATGLASGSSTIAAVLIGSTVAADVGALLANSSKFGPAITTAWAKTSNTLSDISVSNIGNSISNFKITSLTGGLSANSITSAEGAVIGTSQALAGPALNQLNTLAKSSQFGINFSNFSISGLISGTQPAAGFTNTVNRQTVDAAVTRVIGSDKIASPSFGLPSATTLGNAADIEQAKKLLSQAQGATTLAANGVGQAQGAIGQTSAGVPIFSASQVNQNLAG